MQVLNTLDKWTSGHGTLGCELIQWNNLDEWKGFLGWGGVGLVGGKYQEIENVRSFYSNWRFTVRKISTRVTMSVCNIKLFVIYKHRQQTFRGRGVGGGYTNIIANIEIDKAKAFFVFVPVSFKILCQAISILIDGLAIFSEANADLWIHFNQENRQNHVTWCTIFVCGDSKWRGKWSPDDFIRVICICLTLFSVRSNEHFVFREWFEVGKSNLSNYINRYEDTIN